MRSARKAAAIEEGLLLRPGGAAQRRVAVRKPSETTDDVGMLLGVFRELIVAVAARERDAAFLIGEIFRVLEGQIEELTLDMRDLSVEHDDERERTLRRFLPGRELAVAAGLPEARKARRDLGVEGRVLLEPLVGAGRAPECEDLHGADRLGGARTRDHSRTFAFLIR